MSNVTPESETRSGAPGVVVPKMGVQPRPSNVATDYPEFRLLMGAHACATMCTRILFFWAPFAIAKEYPNEPLYLGLLGLVQAIPALSLAIIGGYVADKLDRRNLLRSTLTLQLLSACGMATASYLSGSSMLIAIFFCMFCLGVARGFAEPTMPSLEAQIVPRLAAVSAATWTTIVWHACAVFAPLLAGALVQYVGNLSAFLCSIAFAAGALVFISKVGAKPLPSRSAPPSSPSTPRESVFESISAGWRYVLGRQMLWSTMALDLFAVLFGGAIAMLPLYAEHILHIGPVGLGALSAAPMLGALTCALLCIRFPPRAHAGKILLSSIFGFGICMIVFAISKNFYLSCAALFLSGVLDGVSVVIRKSILRLYSPDHMRGRIAAVNSVFIGASNELGELESGVAAHLLGLVPSVWLGGLTTLVIVVCVTIFGKEVREFDMRRIHNEDEPHS
ncbi:MAG: MFS transporter [Planctomycetes bacterium]|nr:MFS transporter [Planctomycetota bacterium]